MNFTFGPAMASLRAHTQMQIIVYESFIQPRISDFSWASSRPPRSPRKPLTLDSRFSRHHFRLLRRWSTLLATVIDTPRTSGPSVISFLALCSTVTTCHICLASSKCTTCTQPELYLAHCHPYPSPALSSAFVLQYAWHITNEGHQDRHKRSEPHCAGLRSLSKQENTLRRLETMLHTMLKRRIRMQDIRQAQSKSLPAWLHRVVGGTGTSIGVGSERVEGSIGREG